MDWDAEGLLDGLDDDTARAARRALLDELQGAGVPLEELRRAVREDRLALLPVERVLAGEPRYTAREIAERTGAEVEDLARFWQAVGLPVADFDARVYGEQDLEAAARMRRVREAGLPEEDRVEVARVLGQGMARYAEALRTMFGRALLEPGVDERELAHRFKAAAEQLLPLSGPLMDYVFSLHLRDRIRHDVMSFEERTSGRLADTQDTAVGFADLVGFTELGESVGEEELGGLAGRLVALTEAHVRPPCRHVKTIGDAVMLVAPEPAALLNCVLALVEAGNAEAELPALRAGVAFGPAVNRWGDWYGSTVNLASRLTARARPGSVLTTAEVHDRVGEDGYRWSSAGEKRMKGFAAPVRTFRVRRPG
jgi:adenylate cyclase